jgi:hypothetical protein
MLIARAGILILFLFYSITSLGNPGPVGINRHHHFADVLGTKALKKYCRKQIPHLALMSIRSKENLVLNHSRNACFIILDEFATGSGPVVRYFFKDHAYTNQLIKGPGFRWVLQQTISFIASPDSIIHVQAYKNLFYSFSPLPLKPKTWRFAISQHHKTLKQGNLPQFILGSFSITVDLLSNDLTRFTITNYMSRRSLFLHTGPIVQRPQPLGTTKQVITIVLNKREIYALLYP